MMVFPAMIIFICRCHVGFGGCQCQWCFMRGCLIDPRHCFCLLFKFHTFCRFFCRAKYWKGDDGDSCFSLPQCRQLVEVCDEILNSSPETLLTHTAQLESVDLVPVSPGDQLVRPGYYLLMFFTGTFCFHSLTASIEEALKQNEKKKKKSHFPEAQTNKDLIGWSASHRREPVFSVTHCY